MTTKKCECRTINLAKEGHTLEERKCKMLIYEKKYPTELPYVCGPPLELGLKENHPSAKRVRVCTAADIKQTCPPPMCKCPVAKPPPTFFQRMMRLAIFGCKGLVVAGVVYTTWKAGVWGDAKTSECLYVDLKNVVNGTDLTCAESGAPRVDRIMHEGRQKWNQFITCAFKCVSNMNEKMKKDDDCGKFDKKKKKIKELEVVVSNDK